MKTVKDLLSASRDGKFLKQVMAVSQELISADLAIKNMYGLPKCVKYGSSSVNMITGHVKNMYVGTTTDTHAVI